MRIVGCAFASLSQVLLRAAYRDDNHMEAYFFHVSVRRRLQTLSFFRKKTDAGSSHSIYPIPTSYPLDVAVRSHLLSWVTYRFPAMLCSRISFRLSVRQVVSCVIVRDSA